MFRLNSKKVILAVMIFYPLLAVGQDDSNDNQAPALEEDTKTEKTGAPIPGAGVPEVYTVEKGDTLWDLCQKFLNNPWYWPKVWSYNPRITNPHWIYPGDEVYFYPQEGQRPAPLQGPEPLEPLEVSGPELPSVSVAPPDQPILLDESGKPVIEVSGPYQIGSPGFVERRDFFTIARGEEFISRDLVQGAGVLSWSNSEHEMLATRDEAYIRFKDLSRVSVGDKFQIFRPQREITHPFTGEELGYIIKILGQAQVIALNEQWATIKIMVTYDPIERGDLLRPWKNIDHKIKLTKNRADIMDGCIVDVFRDLEVAGEHQQVFLDKGTDNGVREGNQFAVVRRGDGLEDVDADDLETLPDEIVGELVVIETFPKTATAMVTRSLRALEKGDRVVMRAAQ
ncbi:MAG: LysM peptidoglycan-binding domain-containing protein [Deltaproteobacteria bacterium]|nr:LysM peptidoglycan-binding domain-containing protein [Deltaproteobacteria bacterium]